MLFALVLVTALPIVESDEWWIRIWDFPRLQLAVLLLVALAALVFSGGRYGRVFWVALVAGLLALAWQAWHIARYLPLWPVEVAGAGRCQPGQSLRLLNANVLMTNRAHRALLTMVRNSDPDIVLLLETSAAWQNAVRPLHGAYPYRVSQPLPNTYGIILLSKLPLVDPQVRYLLQPHVPSIKTGVRLPSGDVVELYAVHPEPPLPGDDSGERDGELVLVGKEVRASGRAAIVMGDLNDVAWSQSSRLFQRLSGTLDPRVGRGLYPTFPAKSPLLAWPLDHLFVTPHFRLILLDRRSDIGSDHWPMLFGLCLQHDPGRRLNGQSVPADVREDARDQIEDGREGRAEELGG